MTRALLSPSPCRSACRARTLGLAAVALFACASGALGQTRLTTAQWVGPANATTGDNLFPAGTYTYTAEFTTGASKFPGL